MPVRENFGGPQARHNKKHSRRMLKLVCLVYLVHLVCLV